ncbi:hypothetical protein [Arcanobacterium hippocoleae]|uniref:hypothetical protein n=1 Tax=Arcanobacterium hippocoleae TaxID=149017 RepID=UPI00333E6C0C
MIEKYALTASLRESRSTNSSYELFKNFRSNLIQLSKSANYEQILEANTFYNDQQNPAEIEVKLVVVAPLSVAVKQATELVVNAAEKIGVSILDADGDSSEEKAYVEDGLQLVSA